MKNALVIGGARSGKYAALLLQQHGYAVTLTDINKVDFKSELEANNITVVDEGHPDSLLNTKYDLVIKNPGIKYSSPFIKKVSKAGYRIYNEIDIALSYVPNVKVLAVSGTNGKTTTVSLLYEMLKLQYDNVYLGGNIGVAVSELVYKYPNMEYLILELSSFQLDGIYNLSPFITAITNLQNDHLDYYTTIDDYFMSKQRIYQNQSSKQFTLVNVDEERSVALFNNNDVQVIEFGIDNNSDVKIIGNKVFYLDEVLFDISEMRIVGKHNVYNALVASLMALTAGVSREHIQNTLSSFTGVEHRIEYVKTIDNVKYYNDSKATNVESVKVAINAFNTPVILIAGGYDKNISFDDLSIYDQRIKCAIVFGQTKHKLSEVFTNALIVEDLETATQRAHELAQSGDVVLFSPACASFDQFKDYEQRGDVFKALVNQL